MTPWSNSIRMTLFCAVVAVVGIKIDPAMSADSCVGKYSSNVIAPLPPNLVLTWMLINSTSVNRGLIDRFASGLSAAGVKSGDDGNARLDMSFTLTPPPGSGSRRRMLNFSWADPNSWSSGEKPRITGGTLVFSVNVTNTANYQISWTAGGECTVMTEDNGELAEDFGRLLGQTIGKSVSQSIR
jgi:hypothetical protein